MLMHETYCLECGRLKDDYAVPYNPTSRMDRKNLVSRKRQESREHSVNKDNEPLLEDPPSRSRDSSLITGLSYFPPQERTSRKDFEPSTKKQEYSENAVEDKQALETESFAAKNLELYFINDLIRKLTGRLISKGLTWDAQIIESALKVLPLLLTSFAHKIGQGKTKLHHQAMSYIQKSTK